MKYQIKALKSLASGAFEGSLYKDGKRIGTVGNDGRGGSNRVWMNSDDYATRQSMEAELGEWLLTVNSNHWTANAASSDRVDLAVSFLADIAEWDKDAKKKTLVRVPAVGEFGLDQFSEFRIKAQSPEHLAQYAQVAVRDLGDTAELYDADTHAWVKATDIIAAVA